MDNLKISFIIPLYNSENFIENIILNIISQKMEFNIELVLIDDGSIDNTEEVCNKYVLKYPWIKYYKKVNKGVSSARNEGIKKATGEWIYFIDADDNLNEHAIENLFKLVQNTNKDIIITGYNSAVGIDKNEYNSFFVNSEKLQMMILDSKYFKKEKRIKDIFVLWTCWGNLYRKEILIKNNIVFPEELVLGEDIYFLINCYDFCNEIEINLIPTYYYNNENESASKSFNKKRIENTNKLAYLYRKWSENKSEKVKLAVNKFIFQRVLACISKYYLSPENKMEEPQKISEFEQLCKNVDINNSIREVKYKQLIEIKKTTITYIICLFLLRRKQYKLIFEILKILKVY